jgi:homoserine dehydrogenase
MTATLKIGVAGIGTVGSALIAQIAAQRDSLEARCGRRIEVVAVCARNKKKKRNIDLRRLRWHSDPVALANDPGIDVFVELIGGQGNPAKAAIETALKAGKSVVTANKALLARHGVALAALAEKNRAAINFEAAVAGAIPIDAARRARRQFARPRLWHPQRHLQLHPHPDGAGGSVVRGLPQGRAAARLCRGRSDLRHRRS